MGLKDLKSKLDLLGGFENLGDPVGQMENFNPVNFQLPTEQADDVHRQSLLAVPGGDSNSPHQDPYNGATPELGGAGFDPDAPGAFQYTLDVADQVHKSSLSAVPGGDSNSQYQDLNIDNDSSPASFQYQLDVADQVHKDSLMAVPGGDSNSPHQDPYNGATPELGATTGFDMNAPGAFQYNSDIADQTHKSSLSAVPGGDSSSPYQDRLDGDTPSQYINNLPD